ncbi:MAG: Lipopolysaccharide assembly protein B [Calditrichaeota bacterium]|nr:Lipopolysaccharide assembly protein B [Calditrichota bacterium]
MTQATIKRSVGLTSVAAFAFAAAFSIAPAGSAQTSNPPPGWRSDSSGWSGQVDSARAERLRRAFQGNPFNLQHPDSEDAEKLRERMRLRSTARQYEFLGQHERALDVYYKLLEEDASDRQSFDGALRCLRKLGRYEEAAQFVHARLDSPHRSPDRANLLAELGAILYEAGDVERADSVWNRALSQRPPSRRSYQQVASVQVRVRDLERAADTYQRGREDLGEPELFSINLSGLYASMMDWEAAAGEYLNALRENENRLNFVRRGLANFPDRPGANDAVVGAIERELDRDDEPWDGYANALRELLIDQKTKNGDYAGALAAVEELDARTQPHGHRLLEFAAEAFGEGFDHVARDALATAAKRMDDPEGRDVVELMRSEIAEGNGEIERANELLSGVIDEPASARVERAARMRRGLIRLEHLDNPAGAVADFRTVREIGWPAQDRRLDYVEALALVRMDSLDAALAPLRRPVEREFPGRVRSRDLELEEGKVSDADLDLLAARILLWKQDRDGATAQLDTLLAPPEGADAENEALTILHLLTTVNDTAALARFAAADRAMFQDDSARALALFDALASSAENRTLAVEAGFHRAMVCLETRADSTAVPQFADEFSGEPRVEEAWYRLGRWWQRRGNPDDAGVAYEMILVDFPDGLLAALARLRLEELSAQQAASSVPEDEES